MDHPAEQSIRAFADDLVSERLYKYLGGIKRSRLEFRALRQDRRSQRSWTRVSNDLPLESARSDMKYRSTKVSIRTIPGHRIA